MKKAKLLPNTSTQLPDDEKPKKPFGEFSPEDDDLDELPDEGGARSEVSEADRQFHRNTLQREEYNLRHIDSADDIIDEEDYDEVASDKSVSLEGDISGSSVEKIDDTDEVTPTEDNLNRIHSNLQKCIRELDKSFEYLMSQADDIEKNKTDQVRVVEPFLRPSSAGPLSRSSPRVRRDVTKRSSAYLPLVTNNSTTTRPHHNSSSSRDINISTDSMGAPDSGRSSNNSFHRKTVQHSKPTPTSSSPVRNQSKYASAEKQSKPVNKNYYYFGDSRKQSPSPLTLTPEPRPRSRYLYGDTPDLTEILQNLQDQDKNDVAVFDDVKTPVNDHPQLQDQDHQERFLTQEHNMKLLASAAASPTFYGSKSSERARSSSSCDQHKTFSAINKRCGSTPVRSSSERQVGDEQ